MGCVSRAVEAPNFAATGDEDRLRGTDLRRTVDCKRSDREAVRRPHARLAEDIFQVPSCLVTLLPSIVVVVALGCKLHAFYLDKYDGQKVYTTLYLYVKKGKEAGS